MKKYKVDVDGGPWSGSDHELFVKDHESLCALYAQVRELSMKVDKKQDKPEPDEKLIKANARIKHLEREIALFAKRFSS